MKNSKKYKVVNQRVEINGVTREIGTVLTASDFKPETKEQKDPDHPEVSELESLLATGHIEPA